MEFHLLGNYHNDFQSWRISVLLVSNSLVFFFPKKNVLRISSQQALWIAISITGLLQNLEQISLKLFSKTYQRIAVV